MAGKLSDPGRAALMDMNMLAIVIGEERPLEGYDVLLAAAAPQPTPVLATSLPQSVFEAVAA